MSILSGIMMALSIFGFKSDPDSQDLLAKKIAEYSRILKVTNNLRVTGTGGGIKDEKIRLFMVNYNLYRDVQIEEARKNIVKLTEFYLYKINNDPDLENLLFNNPFQCKDLELGISYIQPNGDYSYALARSFTKEGKVFYYTFDPVKDMLVDLYRETYEEALAIVNGQKNASE